MSHQTTVLVDRLTALSSVRRDVSKGIGNNISRYDSSSNSSNASRDDSSSVRSNASRDVSRGIGSNVSKDVSRSIKSDASKYVSNDFYFDILGEVASVVDVVPGLPSHIARAASHFLVWSSTLCRLGAVKSFINDPLPSRMIWAGQREVRRLSAVRPRAPHSDCGFMSADVGAEMSTRKTIGAFLARRMTDYLQHGSSFLPLQVEQMDQWIKQSK